MGKTQRPAPPADRIPAEVEQLRALIREAHEAAQENREILREIKRQRQEWERDADKTIVSAIDNAAEAVMIVRQEIQDALRACERQVNDTTARYLGMRDFTELLAVIIDGIADNMREAMLEAFRPHLPALADKAIGRFIKAQVDAEGRITPAIWVEAGSGVGPIVTDPI